MLVWPTYFCMTRHERNGTTQSGQETGAQSIHLEEQYQRVKFARALVSQLQQVFDAKMDTKTKNYSVHHHLIEVHNFER